MGSLARGRWGEKEKGSEVWAREGSGLYAGGSDQEHGMGMSMSRQEYSLAAQQPRRDWPRRGFREVLHSLGEAGLWRIWARTPRVLSDRQRQSPGRCGTLGIGTDLLGRRLQVGGVEGTTTSLRS
jgi:hypothetical protein